MWKNGQWKTNILEALSLLTGNSLLWIDFENLINNGSDFLYIEIENEHKNTISLSYSKKERKKKYIVNGKNTTAKKVRDITVASVLFSPMTMNLMYLAPSWRRDFLDTVLKQTFSEYTKVLKQYKESVIQRNNMLKNINKGKSLKSEIVYWDNIFIKNCIEVYMYRKKIIDFFQENTESLIQWFFWKIKKIQVNYISKIDIINKNPEEIKDVIQNYINKSREKEIILKTTTIGAHRDDFSIDIENQTNVIDFASRWEVKTIIIGLKMLEIDFIYKNTGKEPILIIDDVLSELDNVHKGVLFKKIKSYQVFMSGIFDGDFWECNKIEL